MRGFSLFLACALAAEVDQDPMCSSWAAAGECTNNAEYMLHTCAKSCSEVKVMTQGGEIEQCAGWAQQGECTRNPKYMMSACPKVCAEQRANVYEGLIDDRDNCIDAATATSCLSSKIISEGCKGTCAVHRMCVHDADTAECSRALRCRELKV